MPKIMLHDDEARQALGRGVAKLAKAVRGTLGPKGMNAIIDRPQGTPLVSRDGVSIAHEIELEDPYEKVGAELRGMMPFLDPVTVSEAGAVTKAEAKAPELTPA